MNTDYEFTEEQNKVIAGCVTMARAAAGCLFALGGVKAVIGLRAPTPDLSGLIFLVFSGLLGVWFLQAAAALDRIVKTEGDDLMHLTHAFIRLSTIFRGIRNAQILLLVIVAITFVFGMVAMITSLGSVRLSP